MLDYDIIYTAMGTFPDCKRTRDGLYVSFNCMYPFFEPVGVCVAGRGNGYIVHDSSEAACSS